jgi:hypothetical protein
MQEASAPQLKYSTFEKLHTLWLQYITQVISAKPNDVQLGFNIKDTAT